MEKKYVLAIDQSTQGTKAILFDRSGKAVGRTDLAHKQIVNENGWVSHDLTEIYQNTVRVVKKLVEQEGISAEAIACLGISNQRETAAAWSAVSGEALAPAIVWQCSRAADICERIRNTPVMDPKNDEINFMQGNIVVESIDGSALREKYGGVAEIIRRKTGLPLSPYFSAAKYAWLQEYVDEVKKARQAGTLCLGTIDTWLLYKLTCGKVYATDYSNASRTQLFNIHTLKWDEEICTWFGIDADKLPMVCDSGYRYGETDLEGFFSNPVPICGVMGDSQAALFGQGCLEKGMVKATYGTGTSVMMNIGAKPPRQTNYGLVTSLAWGIRGQVTYVLEGNVNYTGAVITWLKNDMELIKSPAETEELAMSANSHDNTYLVPAFSGLGAPYWQANAKAMLYGMSRTTGKKEIVKAALESIAYQVMDIVEMMKGEQLENAENVDNVDVNNMKTSKAAKDIIDISELCVDGGPSGNRYLMKFQSDILGVKVKLPQCEESSALGIALMAGMELGIYSRGIIFAKDERKQYIPSMSNEERGKKYCEWKRVIAKVMM